MGRLGGVGGRLMVVYICNQWSHLRNICLRVCVYFVYDSFKDYIQMFSNVLNRKRPVFPFEGPVVAPLCLSSPLQT